MEKNAACAGKFALSVLLHVIILTWLAVHFVSKAPFTVPTKHVVIIDAQLYQPPKHQEKLPVHLHLKPLPLMQHPAPLLAKPVVKIPPQPTHQQRHDQIKSHKVSHHPSHHHAQKRLVSERQISGKQLNKLVLYLYKVIAQHKRYPPISRQLDQQGVAQVAFTLSPNGEIHNLHLVRSSGYPRLDQAALATLRASAPFGNASKYLKQVQQFQLPIAYRLSD